MGIEGKSDVSLSQLGSKESRVGRNFRKTCQSGIFSVCGSVGGQSKRGSLPVELDI